MDNVNKGRLLFCDFCNVFLCKSVDTDVAFNDGTVFSNVGHDDRIACVKCCGNLKSEEDDEPDYSEYRDYEHGDLTYSGSKMPDCW